MRLAAEADLGSETQIGISVRDLEEADAERENLPLPEGAVIDEVRSQGPAAEAGFEVGDVVIEFDGGARPQCTPACTARSGDAARPDCRCGRDAERSARGAGRDTRDALGCVNPW